MERKIKKIILFIFLCISAINNIYASNNNLALTGNFLKLDSSKPVTISSDFLEINTSNDKNYIFLYTKNVVLQQGNSKIYSDKMKIYYSKPLKKIIKADIIGHVRIKNKDILSTCDNAKFLSNKQVIILKGSVKVMQKGNILFGEELIIDMKNNKTLLKGGKKKRINTIFSGEK